ncbi:MAG: hypothetical protein KAG97_04885 [Victivallales bacterium]|nr:hypothetical protein [Victivallales bacterium]
MNIKFLLLFFACAAVFLTSSCASTPKKESQEKPDSVEIQEDPQESDEANAEPPKYKSPFFEEEEKDTYYENEDQDDHVVFDWFLTGLKGFWDIFTYPGRAFD